MEQQFYFVFSPFNTSPTPRTGYIKIIAENKEKAATFIKNQYPDSYYESSGYNKLYTKEEFKSTCTYKQQQSFGQTCHQVFNTITNESYDEPKLRVESLVIEVTRRCNMKCEHCLRGEPEDKDLKFHTILPLLNRLDCIENITFSGGEPTLRTKIMWEILHWVKEHSMPVNSFYIVTNGKEIPDDFLLLLHKWYAYAENGQSEISSIALSKDIFHEPIPPENEKLLRQFSFFSEDKIIDLEKPMYQKHKISLLREGRAKNLSNSKYDFRNPSSYTINGEKVGHNYHIYEDLYITTDGNIISDCNYSYDTMKDHTIGTTKDIETFFDYLETIIQ